MKIAFIHYHLKQGGVTTVIKQQLDAIRNDCDVMVLTGEPAGNDFPVDTVNIPGLGYDSLNPEPHHPGKTAADIQNAILSRWKNGCDVLHVHNPFLAKNKNILKILKELQKNGINLFLQLHDFAEDGRPHAYFSKDEYIADCHYGVINSRDYKILLQSGLNTKGLHKIPNTVKALDISANKDSNPEKYILYPIRAIRRKNIGEAILLSLYFKNKETLAITLPPNSQQDILSYSGWKKFTIENNLNVEFNASSKIDFTSLIQSSRSLITTSINEGFGFAFLEPWTAKKVLWGRKIPDICCDFEENGILLDHLYEHLLVPLYWIDKDNFYQKWKSCIIKSYTLFGFSIDKIDEKKIDVAFFKITNNGYIDFGLLDEPYQKQIISRVISSKKNANQIIDLNHFLIDIGNISNNDTLIKKNNKAVLQSYNLSVYKNKLLEIYKKVTSDMVSHSIDKHALLSHFLNLETFSLLKWNEYVE